MRNQSFIKYVAVAAGLLVLGEAHGHSAERQAVLDRIVSFGFAG